MAAHVHDAQVDLSAACKSKALTAALALQIAEEDLLRAAASVEGSTRHPLADAVLAAAKERNPAALPAATQSSTEPGQGVRASVEGRTVAVGKLDWVQSQCSNPGSSRSNPGGSHTSTSLPLQQWQVSLVGSRCHNAAHMQATFGVLVVEYRFSHRVV